MRHYQHLRLFGSLERSRRQFTQQDQAAVLSHLRKGMTLRDAAKAAGCHPGSIKAMASQGRHNPRSSFRTFALEVDVILRPRNRANLSPEGRDFLAALERETIRSLRREPARQPWRYSGNTSSLHRDEPLEDLEAS